MVDRRKNKLFTGGIVVGECRKLRGTGTVRGKEGGRKWTKEGRKEKKENENGLKKRRKRREMRNGERNETKRNETKSRLEANRRVPLRNRPIRAEIV